MTRTKILTIGYLGGAVIFAFGVVIVGLRALSATSIDPGAPLIGGFVLMIASKYAARAVVKKSERG